LDRSVKIGAKAGNAVSQILQRGEFRHYTIIRDDERVIFTDKEGFKYKSMNYLRYDPVGAGAGAGGV
jgi:hypothetical protein